MNNQKINNSKPKQDRNMKNKTHIHRNKALRFVGMLMLCGLFIGVTSMDVFAQVPPANQQIGNTASATYTDSGNNVRNTTSNTVTTIVQQVAGLTITNGVSKTVSPGNNIEFTHTITNTGNGTDNVTISAVDANPTGGDFDYTNIRIYGDNGGAPDLGNEITGPVSIPATGTNSIKIWIVASVPSSAVDGDTENITVSATSSVGSTPTVTATDIGTVEEDAVINVTKAANTNTAEVGDTLTYTFTYSNTGNAAGTNLVIKDELPSEVTYIPNSATWSGTASPLTDAAGGDPVGITYEYKSGATDSVIYVISNIPSSNSGTISFKAEINTGSEGATITNEGFFTHDDLTGTASTGQVNVNIDEVYGIVVLGPDVVSSDSVNQGATVDLLNRYTNTGTTTDNFTISQSGSTFPSGTQIIFFQTNGSGVATNPYSGNTVTGVAPGATIEVITRITLPASATGGPFILDKTLTSAGDNSKFATIRDSLGGIFPSTVDLTNDFASGDAGALGEGVTTNGEASAVKTLSTLPANTVDFTLFVKNTSNIADNYNLAASTDNTFGTLTLPTGWSVVFKDPSNGNNIITTTGNLAAGASKQVTASVTVPAGFSPGDVALYFRVRSGTTLAADVIHDQVTVLTNQSVTLQDSQTGTIFPGGSQTFTHTLAVNSNVSENDGSNSLFEVTLTNSAAGFTAQIYLDFDEDGIIDPADSLITSAADGARDLPNTVGALNFGDDIQFIVKITAPGGANVNDNNTTTITVSDTQGNVANLVNTDQVTVQTGVLRIDKYQTPDSANVAYTQANLSQAPGDTVYYRLVVYNDGSNAITDIDISDSTPSFTKKVGMVSLEFNAANFAGTAGDLAPYIVSEPANNGTGTISIRIDKLDSSDDDVIVIFAVRINDN